MTCPILSLTSESSQLDGIITFFSVKTVYACGTLGIYPHQQPINDQRRFIGYPTLYNAHQLAGICSGERVNKGRAIGGFGGVAMTEKESFSEEFSGEVLKVVMLLLNYANRVCNCSST